MIDKIIDLMKYKNQLCQELRNLDNVSKFSVCAIYKLKPETHDFMLTKDESDQSGREEADCLIRDALHTHYIKEIKRTDEQLKKYLAAENKTNTCSGKLKE